MSLNSINSSFLNPSSDENSFTSIPDKPKRRIPPPPGSPPSSTMAEVKTLKKRTFDAMAASSQSTSLVNEVSASHIATTNFQKESKQVHFNLNANQLFEIPSILRDEIETIKTGTHAHTLQSMIRLGILYFRCREYQKAIDTLEEILVDSVQPSTVDGTIDSLVPFYLGKCYFKLGQFPQTEQYWLFALEHTNKPKIIYQNLVTLYRATQNQELIDYYKDLI